MAMASELARNRITTAALKWQRNYGATVTPERDDAAMSRQHGELPPQPRTATATHRHRRLNATGVTMHSSSIVL